MGSFHLSFYYFLCRRYRTLCMLLVTFSRPLPCGTPCFHILMQTLRATDAIFSASRCFISFSFSRLPTISFCSDKLSCLCCDSFFYKCTALVHAPAPNSPAHTVIICALLPFLVFVMRRFIACVLPYCLIFWFLHAYLGSPASGMFSAICAQNPLRTSGLGTTGHARV